MIEFFEMMKVFYTLIFMAVTQLYIFVKLQNIILKVGVFYYNEYYTSI